MTTRERNRLNGRLIPILKCELCGWDVLSSSVVQREMDEIHHYFCSTDCEAGWESLDGTRSSAAGSAETKLA